MNRKKGLLWWNVVQSISPISFQVISLCKAKIIQQSDRKLDIASKLCNPQSSVRTLDILQNKLSVP